MSDVRLTDLMDVGALQRIQDGFSKYTGLAALTTDEEGNPITEGSGFSDFCMKLTRKSALGCERCGACDKNGALLTLKSGHATVYDCHAGLMDFAAPIMVEGRFIGSFIGGQVRTDAVDEEKMANTARELGIDPDTYVQAAKETACMEREQIQKAANFLEEIASALSDMAYHNYAALQRSRRLESAAKSQSAFIMDLCTKLNLETNEIPNEIIEAIDYIRRSDGEVDLYETGYNVRETVETVSANLSVWAKKKGVAVYVRVEDAVPNFLLGDAGRIVQLIGKLAQVLLEKKESGELQISIDVEKVSYAARLYIVLKDVQTVLTEDIMRALVEKEYYYEDGGKGDGHMSMLGVHLIKMLLEQLSGSLTIMRAKDTATIRICIPQLQV